MRRTGKKTVEAESSFPPTHTFPALNTKFGTKYSFIDSVSITSAALGFRLWQNEVRGLKNPKGTPCGKIELSCFKSRLKDPITGKNTRVGGCKFNLRLVEEFEDEEFVGWRYLGGTFEHNHELGPALATPRPSGPRATRLSSSTNLLPEAKKLKLTHESGPSDITTTTPPEEILEPLLTSHSVKTIEQADILVQDEGKNNIDIAVNGEDNAPFAFVVDSVLPASVTDYSILENLVTFNSLLPSDPLQEYDKSSSIDTLAEGGIQPFLKKEEKDLDQYSVGFILAGFETTASLISATEEKIQAFLKVELSSICRALYTNPYQLKLITALVNDLRAHHSLSPPTTELNSNLIYPSVDAKNDSSGALDFDFSQFLSEAGQVAGGTERTKEQVEDEDEDWDIGIFG